ncbi:MAG: class V lanthionine synthetase subunit LxmK [Egibacteraceae bacterium]
MTAAVAAPAAGAEASARRMAPRDLREVPEVGRFLTELGLGAFIPESVHGLVGRNDVWAGTTTSGKPVLVKKLSGDPIHTAARMRRLLSYERLIRARAAWTLDAPGCFGWDVQERLIAFEYLQGATSGAELMVAERFDDTVAETMGAGLARLHDTPHQTEWGLEALPPPLPSLELLEGLPEAFFFNCSAAELQAWSLLQRDAELRGAIRSLVARERGAARVPAHCDLRVDQLLLHDGRLYLTDWEEFRLADGARDIGSFAGEWLYRAMLDIVTSRGDERKRYVQLVAADIPSRGVEKLERLRPKVQAFWRGYRRARQAVDDELAVRATAFAGWHLLDRLLAGAANTSRLQPIQRAAAGVGRTALLTPERFVAVLGLDDGEPRS